MVEKICQEGHVMTGEACDRCGKPEQVDAMAAIGAEPKASAPAPSQQPENGVSSNANFWEGDNFKPGAIEDAPDERDYQWKEVGAASAPFDWSLGYDIEGELSTRLNTPGFHLTSNNQNGSGSCGGQAVSKFDAVQRSMVEGVPFVERSAKYPYAQVFAPRGGSGARALFGILNSQGCSTEALCPSYQNGQAPSEEFMEQVADITVAARDDAPNAQARAYVALPLDIDSIAQAIRDNYGVVLGLYGSNNGTWGSAYPTPPVAGQARWAHWMYLGKASTQPTGHAVAGLQSWGPGIGQNGWQWLNEDYVNNYTFAAWSLVFNPNPTPDTFSHTFVVDLNYGETDNEVIQLQTALAKDGEFPAAVPTSGYYGNITAAAVLKFQLKYAVAPVAELNALAGKTVGPATREKLNSLFGAQS